MQGILETEWAKRLALPAPGRQSSTNPRKASSEVDIDGGMSESDPSNENSRMAQSEEIGKQLEKSVPLEVGGLWTWGMVHNYRAGVSFGLSSLVSRYSEGFQTDGLQIVKQIR